MRCEICKRSAFVDGVTLHRVNELGVAGIWRCTAHLTHEQEAGIDSGVKQIVDIIEADNRSKE
jgi:hypothetical protein